MSKEFEIITARSEDAEWREAMRSAGAFLASYRSRETRRGYQRDLHCWFAFCAGHGLHPYRGGSAAPTSSSTCAWKPFHKDPTFVLMSATAR